MNENGAKVLRDPDLSIEEKLDWLVKELTPEEKLHLLSSGSEGVERLGIPTCRLGGEAAHGVEARNVFQGGPPDITTSFPQPIGMSASWDREAIRAAGEVVGKEARALYEQRPWGGLSRWAPTVDLLRDPRWGRNEEAYGEDPVQVGAMASAYIHGMQGDDKEHLTIASTLKHFYANNTEIGRGWKNSTISPRNKYELYLEPFRRCIEDGGAEGVMTAYNRINGVQGLFNAEVKNILKEEFGLTHAVSDGGAMELSAAFSHATAMDAETVARSIRAGVDALSGRPDAVYAGAVEAVELGLLTEEDIDTAIKNGYRTRIRLGVYEEETDRKTHGKLCSAEAAAVCKDLTDRSLVLLKNDGALPVQEDTLSDCVLIGPVGDQWYMDWYAGEAPEHISLRDGIDQVLSEAGQPEGIRFLDACDRIRIRCGEQYLAADGDGGVGLSGTPDVWILEDWGEGSYTFRNETTGKYLITNLAEEATEGIAAAEEGSGRSQLTGRLSADAGRIFSWFDLEVFRMSEERGGAVILRDRFGNCVYADEDGHLVTAKEDTQGLTQLSFNVETVRNGIAEAAAAAAEAGTVILALGHNPMVNAKEEIDRSTIDFIPYQQKLFDEICRANRNVIVVLLTDYPFAINEIDEKARAILWSATGSQRMGRSLADALIGKVAPAGRLTQTWFRSDRDLPDIDDYDIIGGGRTYRYFEGEVLYPFGYGLTYTTFQYGELSITVDHDASLVKESAAKRRPGQPCGVYDAIRRDDRVLDIALTVTNTGERISDEVVQIYASAPKGRVKKPGKQLIGFDRVKGIAPGESRKVSLRIPVRELAIYDVIGEALIIEQGDYEITAAASSGDAGVSGTIRLEGDTPGARDLSKKIKADHYDEAGGCQIVEGCYGYSALAPEGPSVYDPPVDGRFCAVYADCRIPENAKSLRIHGIAPENVALTVKIDGKVAGDITFNTRDYDKKPSEARNHMPRAAVCEELRKRSLPLLWTDVHVPLDLSGIAEQSPDSVHVIRIEAAGPYRFDWFQIV